MPEELTGVRAKLKAHKEASAGSRTVKLDESGIECTVLNFINHGAWMRAHRTAKGDNPKAQASFVAEVVRFEGEKLTLTDLTELVPAGDMLQLIGEVFGGKDGGDSEGEPGKALN
ncbi:hypothetical protein [Phyllobacterium leguminum]|uniref:Uncharacterized protein n=1 Tax=Phyllobacterium leguminum TaxID=314237 RepID=A0A318T5F2_9HYPH|nr:hypothetical protein [Phyllobacterium leguminum]PYE87502.1 hypothetical protein C7477_1123 [Phyllobacterium leguminum]